MGFPSGKYLRRNAKGKLNFPAKLTNPLTGEKITKFYEEKENFNSVFTDISESFEVARSLAVSLFLSTDRDVLR